MNIDTLWQNEFEIIEILWKNWQSVELINLTREEIAENYIRVANLYCRVDENELAKEYLELASGLKSKISIPSVEEISNREYLN